jgi:site-specific recombinase XerD
MYNSGARVSEMTALRRDQVQFGATNFLQLLGKGRKERTVPLWPQTATVLKAWFKELVATPCPSAFPSARGTAMARDGIEYILRQAVHTAAVKCPSLVKKRVCPHVLRHTTAMHLLQSGVDISVIALWLGHESIETTHGYIEADLATKELTLKVIPIGVVTDIFICREQPNLTLADVQQVFQHCKDEYEQNKSSQVSSPHARMDTLDWLPLE